MTIDSYKKGDVDLILTTSGHRDDQGDAVEIAARNGTRIFTVAELVLWMMAEIEKLGLQVNILSPDIGKTYTLTG